MFKIGILFKKSELYLALKNVLILEGFDFVEVTDTKKNLDLFISFQDIKTSKPLLVYSKAVKHPPARTLPLTKHKNKYFSPLSILQELLEAFTLKKTKKDITSLSRIVYAIIDHIALQERKELRTKWYFPNDKHAAVTVSHDIDELASFLNITNKKKLLSFFFALFPNRLTSLLAWRFISSKKRLQLFPSLLSIDTTYGFTPTLFLRTLFYQENQHFLDHEYAFKPTSITSKHHVGLHFGATYGTSSYGYINKKDITPWTTDIKKGKALLHKLTNMPLKGCRAHHGHFWIPDSLNHIEKQFAYDSSVYPTVRLHTTKQFTETKVADSYYRSPVGLAIPFYPIHNTTLYSFLEFPVTHFEAIDKQLLKKTIQAIVSYNGIINGLYHPSIDSRGLRRFLALCQDRKIWKTTLEELSDWYTYRKNKTTKDVPFVRVGGNIKTKNLKKVSSYYLLKNK